MEWSSFAEHSLAGSLRLDKGVSTIEFRAKKKVGTGELPRLYTLELTPTTEVARLAGIAERARSGRACTDWFADAQYGLSFHWTAMSQLRRGKPKPFPQTLYCTADLVAFIKTAGECRIPVSMNVGVYQDGTVSKATMQQLLEIKKAIRHTC